MTEVVQQELSMAAILAYAFLSFSIGLAITPSFLHFLQHFRLGKKMRAVSVDGSSASVFLEYHKAKEGTPTMGGLLIWVAIVLTIGFSRALALIGAIGFSLLQRGQVYLPLAGLLSFGLLGAVDDYMNIKDVGSSKGLNARTKMIGLLTITAAAALWFHFKLDYQTIAVPFGERLGMADGVIDLGIWYVPFFMFVVISMANAVNVTDGLDGLAAGLLILAFGAFGIVAYAQGLSVLAGFCAVTAGAIAAFLWHNIPPALFFMGDTGSLALGGTLAIIAFMIDEVLLLPVIGLLFVVEVASVVMQLTSKKVRGKKIFRAAPIHHHFESLGWGESKVTMRFWIIGMFMAFLGALAGIYG